MASMMLNEVAPVIRGYVARVKSDPALEQGDQKWAFRPMSGILKGLLAEKTIVGPGPFFGHFQKLSGPAQKIQNLTIFWAKNGI